MRDGDKLLLVILGLAALVWLAAWLSSIPSRSRRGSSGGGSWFVTCKALKREVYP